MAAKTARKKGGPFGPLSSLADNLPALILRLVFLTLLDAWGIWMIYHLIYDGAGPLAAVLAFVILFLNYVFLRGSALPLRWIAPGLAFMVLLHIYPVFFTVYTAFTNYGDGHLIEKPLAIHQLESQQYLPENALVFSWTAFRTADGQYALWLQGKDGTTYFAKPGEPFLTPDQVPGLGPLDENGIPTTIEGYQRLTKKDLFKALADLQGQVFGPEEGGVQVKSLKEAAQLAQRYVYDPEQDAMIDQETGKVYKAIDGTFTADDGEVLRPGFPTTVGFRNFARIIESPQLRGPFLLIFGWTFAYAFFSVLLTFALGLFLAIVLNHEELPWRRTMRVLLIVPYALPAFISVLIWRGMFNPILGIIGTTWNPGWFTDALWAKIGILIVNLWLGFPYMFLITTGALQAIPRDIYEAAIVDGASGIYQFWRITLPLLLISVGPLLVGSFAFNFNNFTIIDLYNKGGPPMSGTPTPAGHTDILISYTYRLAFAGGRGADYGLAAAIAILIFIVIAVITLFNFRYTGMLEEVSENV
ncbi:MAG: maltose ABC transporter permease MalF [Chloroflexi bacterium]|nr:maltose ABC transporter permease MalF [Chloroflexota bacterium]